MKTFKSLRHKATFAMALVLSVGYMTVGSSAFAANTSSCTGPKVSLGSTHTAFTAKIITPSSCHDGMEVAVTCSFPGGSEDLYGNDVKTAGAISSFPNSPCDHGQGFMSSDGYRWWNGSGWVNVE